MSFKVAVVLFAIISAITCSYNVSPRQIWSRQRRDAPSIVIGNVDNQIRNNFTISGSVPPGSEVGAGSVLTQANNDYVAINDAGKLVVVMPDVLTKPEPRTVPGLNDTEIRKLLNLNLDQQNAMVIVNLRKSLSILEEYCERISQLVDLAIIAKKTNFENARESYARKHYHERMCSTELKMYLMEIFDYQNDLDNLMNKIRRQESISNSEVNKARRTMRDLVKSHKDLTEKSQEILNSS